jgi:lysyl-tRNA synthetase class 2
MLRHRMGGHWWGYYTHHIQDPGKQPLFLLLVGFIGSFLFIRFSVRMIRRGVKWWPGNVTPGGLHIHHVVFGVFFLLVAGFTVFATDGTHPWIDAAGLLFGIGCGLVLDEFALLLHLEDVYWSEQGRKSVDAVIIGILFAGLLLVGYLPLGVTPGTPVRWGAIGVISVNACFTVVALLKGKFWTGMLGIMIPGLSWISAVRLARPRSPWARWRYTRRPRKFARARRREARWHRRADAARTWFFDLIAGKPTPPGRARSRAHVFAERWAHRVAARLEHAAYAPLDQTRVQKLARLNRLAAKHGPKPVTATAESARRRAAAKRRRAVAAGRTRGSL